MILSAIFGVLGVRASRACHGLRPRWAAWLVEAVLGLTLGVGFASTLFFALLWAGLGATAAAWASIALTGALAAVLYLALRNAPTEELPITETVEFNWTWACALAFGLAMVLFISGFISTSSANPQGEWDAWAIWNLRARFLAGPGTWQHAVSPDLNRTHPEYPLLWSGVIGSAWTAGGNSSDTSVPVAAGLIVSIVTPLLMVGTVALLRSPALGWLAGLLLLTSGAWWRHASAQYADVPLSLFILAAIAAAAMAQARDWHRGLLAISGVLASLAAWTKNEGMAFMAILALTIVILARRKAIAWVAGALPIAALVVAFKLLLAPPSRIFDLSLLDISRAFQVLKGLAVGVIDLGEPTTHPLVLTALAALLLGLQRPVRNWWILAPSLGLLASSAFVLWGTPNELTWQIETTRERLLVQVLPSLLFGLFLLMRIPVSEHEKAAPATSPAAGASRQRRGQKTA